MSTRFPNAGTVRTVLALASRAPSVHNTRPRVTLREVDTTDELNNIVAQSIWNHAANHDSRVSAGSALAMPPGSAPADEAVGANVFGTNGYPQMLLADTDEWLDDWDEAGVR